MKLEQQRAVIQVSGERALFRRPEFRRDYATYDVLTPSAAQGIMDGIHWRPAIKWVIDNIHIVKPISFETVSLGGRQCVALSDVAYVIEAHFVLTERAGAWDEPVRHAGMFRRQARRAKGLYFGDESFPAEVELLNVEDIPTLNRTKISKGLGWMLHSIDFSSNHQFRFFRAKLRSGMLKVPDAQATQLLS